MHHPGGLGQGVDDRLLAARQPDREAVGGGRIGVGGSKPVRADGDRADDGRPDVDRPPGAGEDDRDRADRLVEEAVDGEGRVGGHVVRHLAEQRAGDRDRGGLAHRVDFASRPRTPCDVGSQPSLVTTRTTSAGSPTSSRL
jgi:hypothetical protein